MAPNHSRLKCLPVTADNQQQFSDFFLSKGSPHYCWCMAWRKTDEQYADLPTKQRKQASMERRISQNQPVGILGFIDNEPVGWCSISPRGNYKSLGGTPSERNVWSLVCFFIKRKYRGQGLTKQLLANAVQYARDNGAELVEAYPADTGGTSYRFMGYRSTFEQFGFTFVKKAGTRRNVMQLDLSQSPTAPN